MSEPCDMQNVRCIVSDRSIQIAGHDIWWKDGADKVLTITDKLIGAEVIIRTFDNDTPTTNFLIPVECVPAVIKALIKFSTTGSIAISRGAQQS